MARCKCGRFAEPNNSRCYWCIRLGALELALNGAASISEAQLKEAYRKILWKYHPDKAKTEDRINANKRTQQANDAFRDLKGKQIPPVPPPDPPRPKPQPEPEPPPRTERVREWVSEPPPPPPPPPAQTQEWPSNGNNHREWTDPHSWPPENADISAGSRTGIYNPPPSPFANAFRRPPSALANFIFEGQLWLHKARPWLVAVFLLFIAPPLIIQATHSSSFAVVLGAVIVAVLVLLLVINIAIKLWRNPSFRKVAPILGLSIAGFLLWTETPLSRLFQANQDSVTYAPRPASAQPVRKFGPKPRSRSLPKGSADIPRSPAQPIVPEGYYIYRYVTRPDGSRVPIMRPKPIRP